MTTKLMIFAIICIFLSAYLFASELEYKHKRSKSQKTACFKDIVNQHKQNFSIKKALFLIGVYIALAQLCAFKKFYYPFGSLKYRTADLKDSSFAAGTVNQKMNRVSFEDGFYIHTTCHTTFASLPKPISELIIIHERNDVIEAVKQIYQRCLSYPVIGLDCEWTPVRRKKQLPDVALLQIATRDGYCVLFRTCFMEEVPLPLLKLLADRKIIKVGVNVFYDGKFLRDKYPQMRVNSRFDLRHLSRYCKVFHKKESLAALTKALLPFELEKKNILTYKWENDLSDEMVKYAALDALAGVLIFDKLLSLFHTQASEEPFHSIKLLLEKYFFQPGSPFQRFLDAKVKS